MLVELIAAETDDLTRPEQRALCALLWAARSDGLCLQRLAREHAPGRL
ncbi:MAG: hypothetical protein M3N57_06990 [Actinomycetota bacterium]|nr:hypothetical protein [Actinomycetota bacterium]